MMWMSAIGQQLNFTASADARKIVQNSVVYVEFSLNGDGTNFRQPNFKPFKVVSGPSQSSSMTIVNGAMTRSMSYKFGLRTDKIGTHTIRPASIESGGKTYSSKPITIEVVKAAPRKQGDKEDYFVQIETSTTDLYVGQQIKLDYVLYYNANVRNFSIPDEGIEYDGFYVEEQRVNAQTTREIINGVEYRRRVMVSRLLFAQQTGTYTIGPFDVQLGIMPPGEKRSFFFSSRLIPENVIGEEVTFRVSDLPPTTDPAASNAVGKYQMNATMSKNSITTDDAVTLNMQIVGDGDSKFVIAPNFLSENDFDIYDPNIINDETFQQNGLKYHRKTFEYLFVPKKPGRYLIRPKFQYFDVDSNNYVTLGSRSFNLNVVQGTGNKDLEIINADPAEKLMPIATATTFRKENTGFYKSVPYWALIGLSLLSMMLTGFVYYRKMKSGQLDPEVVRRQKAQEVANTKLKNASTFMNENKGSAFYEEIIRAVKEYISDKFGVPATYLKKETIANSLEKEGVASDTIGKIQSLFHTCELNLYAGGSADNMQSTFDQASTIISELEG